MIEINNVLYNGKSQSGTALFSAAALIHPVEPFKNTVQTLLRDANTIITHTGNHIAVFFPDIDPYLTTWPVVFYSIAHQIGEQFFHLLRIGLDAKRLAVTVYKYLSSCCCRF